MSDTDQDATTITNEDITSTEGDTDQLTELEKPALKLNGKAVENQDQIDLAFIKLKKDEEAKRLELQRQVDELKKTQSPAPAETIQPVPPLPNQYELDEVEYNRLQTERERILLRNKEIEVKENYANQQAMVAKHQIELSAIEKRNNEIAEYAKRAREMKIPDAELQEYGTIVNGSGMPDKLQAEILNDPQGPAITKYLAENQLELYQAAAMTEAQFGRFIESKVIPKLKPTTPLNKDIPPPLDNPAQHGGAPFKEAVDPLLEGATFKTYRKGT